MTACALLLTLVLAQGAAGASPADPPPPTAGDAELSVALTPEHPTVGDRVTAVLTLTAPADALDGEPVFPAWGSTWGEVEIFDAEEPRELTERQGSVTWRQRLKLAAFRPGSNPLPVQTVRVPLTSGEVEVGTPQGLALEVTSVLPVSPETPPSADGQPAPAPEPPEPRPPEPPRELPWGTSFWITAAAMSAAFLGLLLFLWRRRRATDAPSIPHVAPLAELEQRLEAAASASSPRAGHVLLSMALRRYLKRRLGFAAPESTTTEIRRRLLAGHLPDRVTRDSIDILTGCDLVKFSGRDEDPSALATELRSRARTALAVGRDLEAHLRPPEPSEGPSPSPKQPGSGPTREAA